jgi:hypothetical protein
MNNDEIEKLEEKIQKLLEKILRASSPWERDADYWKDEE